MLTDEQQNQLKDILRLIPPDEQAAFLDMLAHDLRGRDLDRGELRRVAEHTLRKFLQHGWPMRIWAAAYLWLGALDSPIDALLYSVDAMSTRGASGLTLQRPWQMMGAGGGQPDATVRDKYGVRVRGDAGVVGAHRAPTPTMSRYDDLRRMREAK